MGSAFSVVGLLWTLAGACLLFFYGLPTKKIGNVVIHGMSAMRYSDPRERDVPQCEWEPIANSFLKQAKILNRLGFGFVALGTVLQIVGICL
jgi:hypothetical protein